MVLLSPPSCTKALPREGKGALNQLISIDQRSICAIMEVLSIVLPPVAGPDLTYQTGTRTSTTGHWRCAGPSVARISSTGFEGNTFAQLPERAMSSSHFSDIWSPARPGRPLHSSDSYRALNETLHAGIRRGTALTRTIVVPLGPPSPTRMIGLKMSRIRPRL